MSPSDLSETAQARPNFHLHPACLFGVNDPWYGGMVDILGYTAPGEQKIIHKLKLKYEKSVQ